MSGKYVSHSLVSGAGKPHDGLRCHEFDTEAEVMEAAKAAVAFQAAVIDANCDCCNKSKSGVSCKCCRAVVISNTVFAPDGSLYYGCTLAYGKVHDDLLAAAAGAFAANHATVARFQK